MTRSPCPGRARYNGSSPSPSSLPRPSRGGKADTSPIRDTVRGFGEILEGKYDDLPEQAFYMVGSIEEAVESAERLMAEGN